MRCAMMPKIRQTEVAVLIPPITCGITLVQSPKLTLVGIPSNTATTMGMAIERMFTNRVIFLSEFAILVTTNLRSLEMLQKCYRNG